MSVSLRSAFVLSIQSLIAFDGGGSDKLNLSPKSCSKYYGPDLVSFLLVNLFLAWPCLVGTYLLFCVCCFVIEWNGWVQHAKTIALVENGRWHNEASPNVPINMNVLNGCFFIYIFSIFFSFFCNSNIQTTSWNSVLAWDFRCLHMQKLQKSVYCLWTSALRYACYL